MRISKRTYTWWMIIGGLLYFFGFCLCCATRTDWVRLKGTSPTPTPVTLDELAGGAIPANRHVTVRNLVFEPRSGRELEDNPWWYRAVTPDDWRRWIYVLFKARTTDRADGRVVLIKSFSVKNQEEVGKFLTRQEITGVLFDIDMVSKECRKELEKAFPRDDIRGALVVEEGRPLPDRHDYLLQSRAAMGLLALGLVFVWGGIVLTRGEFVSKVEGGGFDGFINVWGLAGAMTVGFVTWGAVYLLNVTGAEGLGLGTFAAGIFGILGDRVPPGRGLDAYTEVLKGSPFDESRLDPRVRIAWFIAPLITAPVVALILGPIFSLLDDGRLPSWDFFRAVLLSCGGCLVLGGLRIWARRPGNPRRKAGTAKSLTLPVREPRPPD